MIFLYIISIHLGGYLSQWAWPSETQRRAGDLAQLREARGPLLSRAQSACNCSGLTTLTVCAKLLLVLPCQQQCLSCFLRRGATQSPLNIQAFSIC